MLIGICGKSGTGKSSVVKELEKKGYKRIITDTTRPPRKGEVHGVDYYFDSEEDFDEYIELGEFVEMTSYDVADDKIWRYGTTRGALEEAGDHAVIILNPEGLRSFREKKIPITVFLIQSNETVILSRITERGDYMAEAKRRMAADEKDFMGIEEYIDYTVYNEKDTKLEELANMIIKFAEEGDEF